MDFYSQKLWTMMQFSIHNFAKFFQVDSFFSNFVQFLSNQILHTITKKVVFHILLFFFLTDIDSQSCMFTVGSSCKMKLRPHHFIISVHTFHTSWHVKNMWLIDSIMSSQKGHKAISTSITCRPSSISPVFNLFPDMNQVGAMLCVVHFILYEINNFFLQVPTLVLHKLLHIEFSWEVITCTPFPFYHVKLLLFDCYAS